MRPSSWSVSAALRAAVRRVAGEHARQVEAVRSARSPAATSTTAAAAPVAAARRRDSLGSAGQRGTRGRAVLARDGSRGLRRKVVRGDKPCRHRPRAARDDRRLLAPHRRGVAEQRRREPGDRRSTRPCAGHFAVSTPPTRSAARLRASRRRRADGAPRGFREHEMIGDPVIAECRHRLAAGERGELQAGAPAGPIRSRSRAFIPGRPRSATQTTGNSSPSPGDRHQPHGVETVGLQRGLALARLRQIWSTA